MSPTIRSPGLHSSLSTIMGQTRASWRSPTHSAWQKEGRLELTAMWELVQNAVGELLGDGEPARPLYH